MPRVFADTNKVILITVMFECLDVSNGSQVFFSRRFPAELVIAVFQFLLDLFYFRDRMAYYPFFCWLM